MLEIGFLAPVKTQTSKERFPQEQCRLNEDGIHLDLVGGFPCPRVRRIIGLTHPLLGNMGVNLSRR